MSVNVAIITDHRKYRPVGSLIDAEFVVAVAHIRDQDTADHELEQTLSRLTPRIDRNRAFSRP